MSWHLAWTLAMAAAAGALALRAPETPMSALAALAAVGGAGLLGAFLAEVGEVGGAVVAILAWAVAGATACLLTGGTGGPLAVWCLAPLAAGAAFGRPRLLALGAATGLAAAAVAALGGVFAPLALPLTSVTPAPLSSWLSLLALGTTGLSVAASLVAMQGRALGDDARAREAELALREALDHQPQLLMALYPGGRILEAFGEAPMGLSTADLPMRNLAELVAHDDRAVVEAALRRAFDEGSAEAAFVPAHDPRGWCVLTARRMSATRLVAALRDARAQRSREAELEQARLKAEQQNAGKSRFLANMSHELRTPLNAIMGFSDIMRQRLFGPMSDRYAEYADLIHESGSHLLELINDVLDMSKIEAERFELAREEFDARDAVAAVLRLMRGQADQAGITLRGDLAREPLDAEADRRAVKQIAFNLISNALKFTPKGGVVTVSAQAAEGGMLEIVVSDTGVGIAPEDLSRLGRPFEQAGDAEQKQAGSGLGLSLVRAFARLHGGEMVAESTLGEGTTVTVRMPVLILPAEQPMLGRAAEG
ncbi:HAMP domain-containing sensor histidine kinase [Phenylobacterium sp.]|uniref:sensor histidine kinase n=1 Tax=Phenylobacterium sp. TaxID=1871053 RepID=UPI0025FFB4F3|nr:PAS domain-containing sensor histidine kinase [Phenylobacterium sp.]